MKRDPTPERACRARPRARGARAPCAPPLLGIAWRLGLGLAAVAAVLIGAEVLATRTTREAARGRARHAERARAARPPRRAPCSRSWSPTIARWANIVQARTGADFNAITQRGRCARRGGGGLLRQPRRGRRSRPPRSTLRAQLTRHIETRASARRAAPRSARNGPTQRQAALNRVYQLIASAGGAGVRHQRHPGLRAPLALRARDRHQRGARQRRRQAGGHRPPRGGLPLAARR